MYLPFSFLLRAILISDISSFICHCHLTLFGDTVLGLGQPMISLENIRKLMGKKRRLPSVPLLCPSLIPFPKLKENSAAFLFA